jgi:predicted Zn-dependent peptidase
MKGTFFCVLLAAIVLVSPYSMAAVCFDGHAGLEEHSGRGARQQPKERTVDKLKFPPLEFTPPTAARVSLPNGMTLFILEDHEIPVADISAIIRTGDIYDPPDKVGLAEMAGTVMRSGGTTSQTPDQINEKLEFISASVETGMGDDRGSAQLSCLSKDLDTVLPIFADVLMHPAFREEQVEIARGQMLDGIQRENDSPQSIADRVFPQLIYGKDSPIARSATEQSIKRITRDDLVKFHSRFYHPNNVIMAITGDINKDAIASRIQQAFAGWPEGKQEPEPKSSYSPATTRSTYFVHRDVNQTSLRIGNLAIKQSNPDYFPLAVALQVLGGGFSSRLFNQLRTRQALAYAASASLSGGLGEPGYVFTFSETRADATIKAIETILQLMTEMRDKRVTEQELASAKASMLNSFVFAFDSPHKVAARTATLYYYGMPLDFLQKFRDNVSKVTAEEAMEAAKKYIKPDTAAILVIGNEAAFDKPITSLGSVTTIDLEKW